MNISNYGSSAKGCVGKAASCAGFAAADGSMDSLGDIKARLAKIRKVRCNLTFFLSLAFLAAGVASLAIESQLRHNPNHYPGKDIMTTPNDATDEHSEKGNDERVIRGDRIQAAETIAALKRSAVRPELLAALADPDTNVRAGAAWSLAEIGDAAAVDSLIDALSRASLEASQMEVVTFDEVRWVTAVYCALKKITGKDFGYDLEGWKSWRRKN